MSQNTLNNQDLQAKQVEVGEENKNSELDLNLSTNKKDVNDSKKKPSSNKKKNSGRTNQRPKGPRFINSRRTVFQGKELHFQSVITSTEPGVGSKVHTSDELVVNLDGLPNHIFAVIKRAINTSNSYANGKNVKQLVESDVKSLEATLAQLADIKIVYPDLPKEEAEEPGQNPTSDKDDEVSDN